MFDGSHAAHVVELLELAELSSSSGGALQTLRSKFELASSLSPSTAHLLPLLSIPPVPLLPTTTMKTDNIVFGTMMLARASNPFHLLDSVWGMGCRSFDVGHVYGADVEGCVGKWWSEKSSHGPIQRQDMILIGKGGHPFRNSSHRARLGRAELEKDLTQSLERLCTKYLDVYLLHRDDPTLFPDVCDVVETMHSFVASGRIREWGTSNWSPGRVHELHACAQLNNWTAPSFSSPQFSLAVPSESVWEGTTHLTAQHRQAMVECGGIRVVAWATLAEGFLCGATPDRRGSMACWSTKGNLERRGRLVEMAKRKGCSVAVLAIAYGLNDGASKALVGCRTIGHFQDAVRASSMKLSEREIQYLKCEDQ